MKDTNPLFFRAIFIATFVIQSTIAFFVFATITSIVVSVVGSVVVTIAAGLFVTYKQFENKTILTQIMAASSFSMIGIFLLLYNLVVK